ncbi:hypothetical protein [Streptomyces sp. YIM 130001]|nr:hypothetical protein [Streptomyces sp. YIM 130001]
MAGEVPVRPGLIVQADGRGDLGRAQTVLDAGGSTGSTGLMAEPAEPLG